MELLRKGVAVSIVDLVTIRRFNLYTELLAMIGHSDPIALPRRRRLLTLRCGPLLIRVAVTGVRIGVGVAVSAGSAPGWQRHGQVISETRHPPHRLAEKIGGLYQRAEAKTIFPQLLEVTADVVIDGGRVVVTLHKHSHNP